MCVYSSMYVHIYICVYTSLKHGHLKCFTFSRINSSQFIYLVSLCLIFPSLWKLEPMSSDLGSTFWQAYIPGDDSEYFIKHLPRDTWCHGTPLLGIGHLVRGCPPLCIAKLFSFCNWHVILWVVLWYQVNAQFPSKKFHGTGLASIDNPYLDHCFLGSCRMVIFKVSHFDLHLLAGILL